MAVVTQMQRVTVEQTTRKTTQTSRLEGPFSNHLAVAFG